MHISRSQNLLGRPSPSPNEIRQTNRDLVNIFQGFLSHMKFFRVEISFCLSNGN